MSSSNYYKLIFLWFVCCNYCCSDCAVIDYNNPVAQTAYGQIKGKQYTYTTTGSARQVVSFIGVPYARAPTGNDRFLAPRPPDPWTGTVLDCTNNRVLCPQVDQRFTIQDNIKQDEDCLHLNIYVPVSNNQFSQNMPVLVYFHGGEFKYGGKDLYKPDYLLENSMVGTNPGIIVITVNYRLGVLGFLSTDDINQPGNNGIRDQIQALRWISENIGAFNGNAANVTIMGHDAGAISVSMLVLSQDASPYFSAAISIGGTVFTPWAFKDNAKQQAFDFAGYFKCDLRTDRLVECLRNQDLGALLAKSRDRDWDNNYQRYWFRPVVDRNVSSSAILKDYPLYLYQNGRYKQCPYIVGITKSEGSLEYYLQYDRVQNRRTVEEKIAFLIRPFLKDYASEDIIASAIKYQYFSRNQSRNALNSQYSNSVTNNRVNPLANNRQLPLQQQQQPYQSGAADQNEHRILVEMMGDFLYVAPTDYVARLHSSVGGHSWLFVFEYEGTKSFGPIQQYAPQVSRTQYGVTHMDDVFSLLPNDYVLDTTNQINDRTVANIYAKLISTLVQTGTIPVGSWGTYGWQQYTPQNPNYLMFPKTAANPIAINANPTQNAYGYRTQNADFFNGFIYELQDKTTRYPTPFPYDAYNSYQAATWSLVGFVLLIIIILVIIIAVLLMKRKKKNELKLLRRTDRELEERFNTT